MADAPHAGKPIYETALRLQAWCELEVFCPVSRYPRARWLRPRKYAYHPPDPNYAPAGVKSHYPEFPTLPWVGRLWNGLGSRCALEGAVRTFRPDVILSYFVYPAGWAAVSIGRRLDVPVVVGSRGSDLHRIADSWVRRMTAATLRRAAATVTVTEQLRLEAIKLGADPARAHTIHNGCDGRVYHPMPRQEARLALGLPPQAEIVLQVGHIIPSKGVFDLFTAFQRLASSRPELRLALIGDGPACGEVQSMAGRAGLQDRLWMPGVRPVPEIAQWMNAADVVCLASHGEGSPNVVLEALSCGRPVVGSDVGGIPELLAEDCGILTPARDPEALARSLQEALTRTWFPDNISRRHVRSWEEVARETFAVCQSCLAEWPAAGRRGV
jgi:teichuronic acid biosynthesis glycosyltransferase TuaC